MNKEDITPILEEEINELVTNCDRFNTLKHSSVCPHAFT